MSCENCKHWSDPTTNQGWKWCNRLRIYSPYFFHCQAFKEKYNDKLDKLAIPPQNKV
jgi:methionyl-tRNA synthetase